MPHSRSPCGCICSFFSFLPSRILWGALSWWQNVFATKWEFPIYTQKKTAVHKNCRFLSVYDDCLSGFIEIRPSQKRAKYPPSPKWIPSDMCHV